jgi:hypothetical protein
LTISWHQSCADSAGEKVLLDVLKSVWPRALSLDAPEVLNIT